MMTMRRIFTARLFWGRKNINFEVGGWGVEVDREIRQAKEDEVEIIQQKSEDWGRQKFLQNSLRVSRVIWTVSQVMT